MELREPKRKRRVRVSVQQPFPTLNRDAISANKELWQVYTGKYSGDFVVVDAPDEMLALHTMGFFGKGSLSRAGPEFGKERQGIPPFIRHRQWKRRCEWAEQQKTMMVEYNRKQGETLQEVTNGQETVVENKDNEKETVSIENQPSPGSCSSINTKQESSIEQSGKLDVTTNSSEKTECVVENTKNSGVITTKINHEVMNTDDEIITIDSTDEDNVSAIDKNSAKSGDAKDNKSNARCLSESNEVNDCEENSITGIKRKRTADVECDGSKVNSTVNLSESHTTEEEGSKPTDGIQERMFVVVPDSDSDDEGYLTNLCPRLEKEVFPIRETLHLTLEEAFFLSYGLGCLQVIDLFGNYLALDGMWQLFCKSQKDFIPKYVIYHYFRSKGWIVKPGIKFGGDFLLYKHGPPFYHASYIVVIEVVDKSSRTRIAGFGRTLSWTRLMGLNRLAESAGKNMGWVIIGGRRIKCIRFAADMVVLAEEETILRECYWG
ncbi:hypothetical protein ANN_09575 [Periplaneta americana]|uniref:tRNA-splicing endonuclease subunit Sen2 n=1 Tax=Periplaneta americana TaxID=6978 RepID=A0ABQ8TLP5_PERAM|nr:hypothetical protein ANN_09575 [Periplaneta americana]